jgi:peptidoglycan/xylan/chitin deacetylase (PgdA/CDA1 family)
MPYQKRVLYLTFDDGPDEKVTPWVLDRLAEFNAKATFFCIGKQVDMHPELHQRLHSMGHGVANHSFTHLDGWGSENIPYFHDVRQGATRSKSDLFRPPYGHLKMRQAQFLQRHYKIVMWDVMSGDFDESIDAHQVTSNVMNNATGGSIVVFHDTAKAFPRLEQALPAILSYFHNLGYRFESLSSAKLISTQDKPVSAS